MGTNPSCDPDDSSDEPTGRHRHQRPPSGTKVLPQTGNEVEPPCTSIKERLRNGRSDSAGCTWQPKGSESKMNVGNGVAGIHDIADIPKPAGSDCCKTPNCALACPLTTGQHRDHAEGQCRHADDERILDPRVSPAASAATHRPCRLSLRSQRPSTWASRANAASIRAAPVTSSYAVPGYSRSPLSSRGPLR